MGKREMYFHLTSWEKTQKLTEKRMIGSLKKKKKKEATSEFKKHFGHLQDIKRISMLRYFWNISIQS